MKIELLFTYEITSQIERRENWGIRHHRGNQVTVVNVNALINADTPDIIFLCGYPFSFAIEHVPAWISHNVTLSNGSKLALQMMKRRILVVAWASFKRGHFACDIHKVGHFSQVSYALDQFYFDISSFFSTFL